MLSDDTKRCARAAPAESPKASRETPMLKRDVNGTPDIFNKLSLPARAVTKNPTAARPASDIRSNSAENAWYLSSSSQSCFKPSVGMSGGRVLASGCIDGGWSTQTFLNVTPASISFVYYGQTRSSGCRTFVSK